MSPKPAPTNTTVDPIAVIEFLPDGCALVRKASGAEQIWMGCDVPEFLLVEARKWREINYGG